MSGKTAMQRYLDAAMDAGYSISQADQDMHILVIDEPNKFVLVVEDGNSVEDDAYFVSSFVKRYNDYSDADFEGTLRQCLEFVRNRG